MTRNEEYQALLQELETTPAALDGAVERALPAGNGTAACGSSASRRGAWRPASPPLCCW